jgi:hypothetical protein
MLLFPNTFNQTGNVMKIQCTLAVVAMLAAGLASAGPLGNGNFESGSLNPWQTTGNVALVEGNGAGFYWGASSAAQSGNYAVAFNGGDTAANGTVSQSFNTVMGHAYIVAFEYGPTSGGAQSVLASVRGSNGTTLASITATDSNPAPALAAFSYQFVADGSTASVLFADVASNQTFSRDGVLDNVISPACPSPRWVCWLGLPACAPRAASAREPAAPAARACADDAAPAPAGASRAWLAAGAGNVQSALVETGNMRDWCHAAAYARGSEDSKTLLLKNMDKSRA